MLFTFVHIALLAGSVVNAAPVLRRAVTKLDDKAVAEAQQRDGTATRAFTAVPIKASDGTCFTVDPLSGDFRENLTPVTLKKCDGSKGQQWDVITAGKHNDVAGQALVVSSLTNACLNFDPRRQAGNQVLLFSCGGRADGEGKVVNSQQFAFKAGDTTIPLTPLNGAGKVCLVNKGGNLDQAACNGAGNELFTIGNGKAAAAAQPATKATAAKPAKNAKAAKAAAAVPATITPAAAAPATGATKTTALNADTPVSRAGGKLNPTAAAESNQFDATATRAFTKAQIKTSNGQCLSVDPTAGDFRQLLIPIQIKACNAGDAGQQWDFITKGKHNNIDGQTLVVSSLTNGCLNFDSRRAAGDQVLIFSCGGRADGDGKVVDSQQFPFTGGKGPLALSPLNSKGKLCLAPGASGNLDAKACDSTAPTGDELFTIVA